MRYFKIMLILLFLPFISLPSFAGDASACISVGSEGNSNTLKNTCGYEVEVVWCLKNRGDTGSKSAVCDYKGKFYQKHTVLKPGEVKSNKYSLSLGTTVYYGACRGGYYSTKQTGNGSYNCK